MPFPAEDRIFKRFVLKLGRERGGGGRARECFWDFNPKGLKPLIFHPFPLMNPESDKEFINGN